MKRPIVQAAVLVLAALVLALAANAFASRQRRMMLVGFYPNARKVTPEVLSQAKPVAAAPVVAAPAPVPAPVVTTTVGATASAPEAGASTQTQTQAPAPAPLPVPVKPAAPQPRTPAATPQPVPAPAQEVLARFTPHPDKPYIEIGYDDVAALHDKGVLFLDARRTSVYEQGHIAGARPFSVWESDVDDKVNKLFAERSDPDAQAKPIVIYCSGGECEDSHMLAQKLWGIQFNNVYVYKDGFPDWQKRGGAVHTGTSP